MSARFEKYGKLYVLKNRDEVSKHTPETDMKYMYIKNRDIICSPYTENHAVSARFVKYDKLVGSDDRLRNSDEVCKHAPETEMTYKQTARIRILHKMR